jgi:hypothetical protein
MWDPWINAKATEAIEKEQRALAHMEKSMIRKFKGDLAMPNGEILACDIEIDVEPVPIGENIVEQTRYFNESMEKMREQRSITLEYPVVPIPYEPSGPIVGSTLAKTALIERYKALLEQEKVIFPAQPDPALVQECDDLAWGVSEVARIYQDARCKPTGPVIESTLAERVEE